MERMTNAQIFYVISDVKPEVNCFEGVPVHWYTPDDFQVADCMEHEAGIKCKIRFRHPDKTTFAGRWVNGWTVLKRGDMSPGSWRDLEAKLAQDNKHRGDSDRHAAGSKKWHTLAISCKSDMALGMRVVKSDGSIPGIEYTFELCEFWFDPGSLILGQRTTVKTTRGSFLSSAGK